MPFQEKIRSISREDFQKGSRGNNDCDEQSFRSTSKDGWSGNCSGPNEVVTATLWEATLYTKEGTFMKVKMNITKYYMLICSQQLLVHGLNA